MEMETEQNVTLRPVLAMHGYSMDFSQAPGKATYRFRVESGDIEIHHNSFDGRCWMWTLPPESGDAPVKAMKRKSPLTAGFTTWLRTTSRFPTPAIASPPFFPFVG